MRELVQPCPFSWILEHNVAKDVRLDLFLVFVPDLWAEVGDQVLLVADVVGSQVSADLVGIDDFEVVGAEDITDSCLSAGDAASETNDSE